MASEKDSDRLKQYRKGLTDAQIAAQLGETHSVIQKWRHNRGLPPHRIPYPCLLPPERRARRMLHYQLNWSDGAIAKDEGVSEFAIWKWRRRLSLKPNSARGKHPKRRPLEYLLRRIRRAIGPGIGEANCDDAVSEMLLGIIAGTVPFEEIEARAYQYGTQALRSGSRFDTRSLDAVVSGTDDLRMIDMLPDERSSSWLEEMGATVW